jgi:hypothetical protein
MTTGRTPPASEVINLCYTSHCQRLGGCKLEGNAESTRYLHNAVAIVNKELENAHLNGLSDGIIAAVSSMANMEVSRITSLGWPS